MSETENIADKEWPEGPMEPHEMAGLLGIDLSIYEDEEGVTATSNSGGGGEKHDLDQGDDKRPGLEVLTKFPLTQVGNAERLRAWHSDMMVYAPHLKSWMIWDGARWAQDECLQADDWMRELCRTIHVAADGISDKDVKERFQKFSRRSEKVNEIAGALKIASAMQDMNAPAGAFDRDGMLFNTMSGTIDLRTCELLPHKQSDMITKVSPVYYDPDAECDRWDRFVGEVTDGNVPLQLYLQRLAGYSLTAETTEQSIHFFYGHGSNGKSTYISVLKHVMGDYAQAGDSSIFQRRKKGNAGAASPERARLKGARLVVVPETQEGGYLDESFIKDQTGGETIEARPLFGRPFEFKPTHKPWISGNHKPTIIGTDNGIWRRFHVIPFTRTFQGDQLDPDLMETLKAESPGILAWKIRGLKMWQEEGLNPPSVVLEAVKQYRDEMDDVGQFLAEKTEKNPDTMTPAGAIYEGYCQWAKDAGLKPITKKALGQKLDEKGIKHGEGRERYCRVGLGLLQENKGDDDLL